MTDINSIANINNISDTVTRADPLGQPLSTPLGTEHMAPVPAPPRPAPPVFAAGDASLNAADADTAPSNRAGLLTKIFASTSVLLLLGVGLYAWLR